ncbi:MAG TPA: alpha/beta fold hydrolase [Terriglobales bacterium]|nr:alpha/beta fold hydrolase [Terriglobales bacterium]
MPRRFLSGGHLQTLVSHILPRKNGLSAPEERLFQVDTDVQVLCHCHWQPDRAQRTTIIIVHGLEGSSESQYVVGTSNKAWDLGMNVVRMNMRNCGGSEKLTPTLYNCSMSGDVGAIVRTLIEGDGLQSIALAGFSMGGNLVLKLAGEWHTDAPRQLAAVTAVSPIIDLSPSSAALHDWQNRLYEYRFLRDLHDSVSRKAKLYPDRYKTYPVFSIRSLREFDDKITAPHGGFKDAEDYYHRAGSAQVVHRIAVPTLIIHSLDDPFIRLTHETRSKILANPHIRYLETRHGGHCAFLAQADGYDGRWAERTLLEFVREFAA